MSIAQGIAALVLIFLPADARMFVFVPFFVFEAFYAAWTMRRIRHEGIILG
jgi:hypothetical protein